MFSHKEGTYFHSHLNFAHVTSWFHSTCNIYSVTPNVILRFLSSHNSGHNTSLKTLIEILLSKYILTKKNLLGLIRLEVETSGNCLDLYFLIVSLVGWQSLPVFHNNDAHEMSEMYAKSKIWFDFHLLFRFFLTSFSRNNASFCITMNDSFDERAKLLLLQLFSHCFRFLCVWNSEYKPHFGERKVIIWCCFSLVIQSFIKYWNSCDAKSLRLAMLHQMQFAIGKSENNCKTHSRNAVSQIQTSTVLSKWSNIAMFWRFKIEIFDPLCTFKSEQKGIRKLGNLAISICGNFSSNQFWKTQMFILVKIEVTHLWKLKFLKWTV